MTDLICVSGLVSNLSFDDFLIFILTLNQSSLNLSIVTTVYDLVCINNSALFSLVSGPSSRFFTCLVECYLALIYVLSNSI